MGKYTFDTYKFVDRLEKAGFPREQAAVILQAQQDLLADAFNSTLAAKADIGPLNGSIAGHEDRILNSIARLERRIDRLELELTITFGIMIVAAVVVTAALFK
jgi:hypothetical protein